MKACSLSCTEKLAAKNICSEINTVTPLLFCFASGWSASRAMKLAVNWITVYCHVVGTSGRYYAASRYSPPLLSPDWLDDHMGLLGTTKSSTEQDTITLLPLSEIYVPGYFYSQCFQLYTIIYAGDSYISLSFSLCSTMQTAKENNYIGQYQIQFCKPKIYSKKWTLWTDCSAKQGGPFEISSL